MIPPPIVDASGPYTDEFHLDEKWFYLKTMRKIVNVCKSDKAGAEKTIEAINRRHNTKAVV